MTLGCARNEVDSEELAGRLQADGFPLVADPESADTVVVNTCGFVEAAKKDSVDAILEAADLRDTAGHGGKATGRGGGRLHGRAVRRRAGQLAAGGRRGPRLRRLPGHRGPAAVDRGGGDPSPAHPAGPSAAPPHHSRRAGQARPSPRAPGSTGHRPRRSSWPTAATGAAPSARSRCSAARSSAAVRARCSTRPGGWPPRACASSSSSARTPRRTARTSATSGCSRPCCPSSPPSSGVERVRVSYLQPAETRPGLIEAIAIDARRGAVLRPLLPARQQRGAPPDAPLRRPRQLPRAARPGALARARPPASGPT